MEKRIKHKAVVIGLGLIGMKYGFDSKRKQPASHVAAILENPNIDLIAVCDADRKARELFTKKYGNKINVYNDYEKLIRQLNQENKDFDIMVIATPDNTHEKILKFVIENMRYKNKSCIIFCEKPLTTDIASAERIRRILKATQAKIVVNHSRRWSDVWREAYNLTKKLGHVEKAAFYFSTSPENKQLEQIRDGIHIADLINWFCIAKQTTINRLIVPYFVYDFYIWGSKGKIEILNNGDLLKFFKIKDSNRYRGFQELELVHKKRFRESILSNVYGEFVDFLEGGISSLSTNIDDAVEAVRVFEKYVYDDKISKTGEG